MRYIPTPPYINGTAYNAVPLNGGYYNYNPYNGYNPYYYNPIYYQRQQEEYEKQKKQEFNNQVTVWKTFLRSTDVYYGVETDEEKLNQRFSEDRLIEYQQYQNELAEHQNIYNIVNAAHQQRIYDEQMEQYRLQQIQEINEKNKQNEDGDLLSFLRGPATERYIQALENRSQASRVMKNLYDQSAYSRLLGVHENNLGMFGSLRQNVSIDDMEIQLPQHLKTEREIKRKQFMESILQQPKGW